MRALLVATAMAMAGLANVGCNAITGLDKNYVEVDCFPTGSCSDGSMPDGSSNHASMPDNASSNVDSPEGVVDARGQADAVAPDRDAAGPDAAVESGATLDSAPESSTDRSPCTDSCTGSSTQCSPGGVVQTCVRQAGGCTSWISGSSCGVHQSCVVANGVASCACSASQCSQTGTLCQDPQTLATCAEDGQGCFYLASTSACIAPKSCSGMAPGATCSLTCSDSCSQGQTSCVSGSLATCTLGSNGCRAYGAPVACGAHQSCTGAAGASGCTCNTDPVCNASGNTCANSTTLATCSKDAQSCVYQSASTTCTNGICSGTACCTNTCSQGQTACINSGLVTCTLGANGCWSYGMPAACGPHRSCTGTAGSASCTCNTDPVCGSTIGGRCADSSTLATCAKDAQNCVYESGNSTCTNGACSAGACCTNACSTNATRCTSPTGGEACSIGSNGCYQWGAMACSASICSNGACVNPPSCQGGGAGMMNCGPNESCCTSIEVPGGTYTRLGRTTATLTGYRLDKYLVTVGRFRQFVNAVIGGYLPPAGSGKHKHLNGGSGLVDSGSGTPPSALETGWLTADNANIAPNGNLGCNGSFSTWTNTAGNQENLPITCENWFEARAFCIWDGGFLPSESEWEFAGVGGSQQRAYPWGSTDPGTLNQYAIYSCYFGGGAGPNTCTGTANIAAVGSVPLGAGLWGHLDMAGDAAEWTLDQAGLPPTTCTDCAYLTGGDYTRATHGGGYNDDLTSINPLFAVYREPLKRLESTAPGFRCARIP